MPSTRVMTAGCPRSRPRSVLLGSRPSSLPCAISAPRAPSGANDAAGMLGSRKPCSGLPPGPTLAFPRRMNAMMIDVARRQLVTRGRRLLRHCGRCSSQESSTSSGLRSESFDDLIAAEVRSLSLDNIALLARIRRTLARIASDMFGTCTGCGAAIEAERLCSEPEMDRCVSCAPRSGPHQRPQRPPHERSQAEPLCA